MDDFQDGVAITPGAGIPIDFRGNKLLVIGGRVKQTLNTGMHFSFPDEEGV